MVLLKKIRCSCFVAAAVFLGIVSHVAAQSSATLPQTSQTSQTSQASQTSVQTAPASSKTCSDAVPAAIAQDAASVHTMLAQSVVAQLSLEEKAAQVLMVNIAGSKTADANSIASLKGTVPGAVLLFG